MMTKTLKIEIPARAINRVYRSYLCDYKTKIFVFYGGGGSGKSYFIAEKEIVKLLTVPRRNLMVVRRFANTNRTSTFALFNQIISAWGLSRLFRINVGDMAITVKANGNQIIFRGLDNSEKLKSITFKNGVLTDVWIEEASEVDEKDLNQLMIRLRGRGSQKQLFISFNPTDINHWLKKRFFDIKNDNCIVCHTTYKDNDFLSDEDRKTLESFKDIDPYYYAVYCLGQWGVFGQTIFPAAEVQRRLDCCDGQNITVGLFDVDKFTQDDTGYIKIYRQPQPGVPYVIGADTSGEGSDFFVACVIDNITGRQVAVLRHQTDEDLFAKQLVQLGRFYNNALLAIEANFSTFPIREVERLGYKNQYVREDFDEYTHKPMRRYGFKTTARTRPQLIAELVRAFRDNPDIVCDRETLFEMLTFVRNEKGRPEAQSGAHDDCVMALGIAHIARDQQRGYVDVADAGGKKVEWTSDMREDFANGSAEERAEMIKLWGNPDR